MMKERAKARIARCCMALGTAPRRSWTYERDRARRAQPGSAGPEKGLVGLTRLSGRLARGAMGPLTGDHESGYGNLCWSDQE